MAMALSCIGCANKQQPKNVDDVVAHLEQTEEELRADISDEANCENDSCDFQDCLSGVWPPINCYVTEELAKKIVSQKGDVNALNANEETPLMFAKDAKTAKLLIDAGADLDGKVKGRTKEHIIREHLMMAHNLIHPMTEVNHLNLYVALA